MNDGPADQRVADALELRGVNNGLDVSAATEFAPLAFARPTRRDLVLASSVIVVSLLLFATLAPFAKTRLAPIPAFIGVYQAALIVSDLITAAYLLGQYRASHLRSLFLLASDYLFTAILAFIHLLTFPGLFSESGLLGAGTQTTAWLYMAWHVVFPLFVVAYALAPHGRPSGREIRIVLIGMVMLIAAAVAVTTAGQQLLPEIMDGNRYAPGYATVVVAVWLTSAVALFVVWRKRERTVLDLRLIVVMCAWLCDIALAAVFNAGRYDLGFYSGRLYGLLAATFVLCVLLLETTSLQARVAALAADAAASREQRRAEAALRAKSAQLQESQRQLDAVLDNASVAMFLMDEQQHCVYMNAAAEQLTEFSLDETRGRRLHDVVHHTRPNGRSYPVSECPIDRAFPQNNKEKGEEIFVHKDGSFYPVAFTASPIRDEAAKVIGTIIEVRDVREEKRVREELQASERRLLEADRRKDEFLATLAHELRNRLPRSGPAWTY